MIKIEEVPLLFTKSERATFVGDNNRKSSQDEKFQKQILKDCFDIQLLKKKGIRINENDGSIKILINYMQEEDPSAWTEDFDGIHKMNNTNDCMVFALKMLPEQGGAQSRATMLIYKHIKCCVKSLQNNKSYYIDNLAQVNIIKYVFILDGEYLSYHWDRMNKLVPDQYKHYFYIGPSKYFTV